MFHYSLFHNSYIVFYYLHLMIVLLHMNLNFEETKIEITKVMSSDAPRRVSEIKATLIFTKNFIATDEQKEQLVRIARSCPVEKSLHPDIKLDIQFFW